MGTLGGRVHPAQLAEYRACPPHRDAQIVEELAVEVIKRPGHVRLGDVGQPPEHQPGGPAALMAVGLVVEKLHAEQGAARAAFAERFDEFASPEQRLVPGPLAQPVERVHVDRQREGAWTSIASNSQPK